MKTVCGRLKYTPEIGIYDNISGCFIGMDGEIMKVTKSDRQVQFTDATKKLIQDFIDQIKPHVSRLDEEARIERLNANQNFAFRQKLNEGYID